MATRHSLIHLTALAGLAAWAALAQGAGPDTPAGLAPISVTATRNPIRTFEFPGMVTMTGRESIRAGQPSTPDDVLRSVPNVEFTGGPRRTGEVPSIRGFDGPDVVIILDGARQNFGSAHDGRFFLDPSLLREVEVLRGPASSLYGSGGTGGVIEFRTVEADDLLAAGEHAGATISAGYQTVNRERTGTILGSWRSTDAIDVVGAITRRDSGSIELGDGKELFNTDDDIVSGLAKVGVDLGSHHRIEGSFQRFSNDAEEPNNAQGTGGADIVAKDIRTDNWRLAYRYGSPADKLLDIDFVAYRTKSRADELRLDANGAGPAGELLKRDVETIGLRLDNRSRIRFSDAVAVTLTYGGEVYRDDQNGAAGAGERDGVPDAAADFHGVFAQAEIAIAEPLGIFPGDLLVFPGLRYDAFETSSAIAEGRSASELSPRISASYLPTDWLMLFASHASAFRAPTFDESFLTGTHFVIPLGPVNVFNRFVPNPDLRPQATDTLELGGGISFDGILEDGDRIELKGSYFRTEGEDFINLSVNQPALFIDCNPFAVPGSCDGTTTSANVANATLRGVEIEGFYESRRTRLKLGYSRLDGKNDDTGAKLGLLTPPELHLDAALKFPARGTTVGWRLHAAETFDEINTPGDRRGGYAVHDLYLIWAPARGTLKGLRFDLGVENVLDKAYSRVFTGANEAGRNVKAALSYEVRW